MYSAGCQGVTEELDLQKAGLAADHRGRITVDGQYLSLRCYTSSRSAM
jgi:NAD(P) transhydrogenase